MEYSSVCCCLLCFCSRILWRLNLTVKRSEIGSQWVFRTPSQFTIFRVMHFIREWWGAENSEMKQNQSTHCWKNPTFLFILLLKTAVRFNCAARGKRATAGQLLKGVQLYVVQLVVLKESYWFKCFTGNITGYLCSNFSPNFGKTIFEISEVTWKGIQKLQKNEIRYQRCC